MHETKHRQHHINSGFIRVISDNFEQIPAFWAHPTIGGSFPGLILLHDDWGLEAATRQIAHRFAEIGYYVIVPDLFEGHRAHNQQEADKLEDKYRSLAPPKTIAGLGALETHPKCNHKLAIVGWDLGAELAMELATKRRDIMATVSVSGDPSNLFGRFDELRCPLLLMFGELDEITTRTADRAKDELTVLDKNHQVNVYPKAKHSFYHHLTPDYHEDSAEDAWDDILTFLHIHQGKPPAPSEAEPGHFRPGRVY